MNTENTGSGGRSRASEPIPRWLRLAMISDRAGSAWFIGSAFFFAPVLAVVSPWPIVTGVLWVIIGVAGVWLALLGVVMAIGLAKVLRDNTEVPEEYWWSLLGKQRAGTR